MNGEGVRNDDGGGDPEEVDDCRRLFNGLDVEEGPDDAFAGASFDADDDMEFIFDPLNPTNESLNIGTRLESN